MNYQIKSISKEKNQTTVRFQLLDRSLIQQISNEANKKDATIHSFLKNKFFEVIIPYIQCSNIEFENVLYEIGLSNPTSFNLIANDSEHIEFEFSFFNKVCIETSLINEIFTKLKEKIENDTNNVDDKEEDLLSNDTEENCLITSDFDSDSNDPIERGDLVFIDINTLNNGKLWNEYCHSNYPLIVGYEKTLFKLNDLLIGHRIHDSFSATVPLYVRDKNNKEVQKGCVEWHIKINNVKKVIPTISIFQQNNVNIKKANIVSHTINDFLMKFIKSINNNVDYLPGFVIWKRWWVFNFLKNAQNYSFFKGSKYNHDFFDYIWSPLSKTGWIKLWKIDDITAHATAVFQHVNLTKTKPYFTYFDTFLLRCLGVDFNANDVCNMSQDDFTKIYSSLFFIKKGINELVDEHLKFRYLFVYALNMFLNCDNKFSNINAETLKYAKERILFRSNKSYYLFDNFWTFIEKSYIKLISNCKSDNYGQLIEAAYKNKTMNDFICFNDFLFFIERLWKNKPDELSQKMYSIINCLSDATNKFKNDNPNSSCKIKDYISITTKFLIFWNDKKYFGYRLPSEDNSLSNSVFLKQCIFFKNKIRSSIDEIIDMEDNVSKLSKNKEFFVSSLAKTIPYFWDQCYSCFEADARSNNKKYNFYTVLQNSMHFLDNNVEVDNNNILCFPDALLINAFLILFRNIRSNVNNHSGFIRVEQNKLVDCISNKFKYIENRDTFFIKTIFCFLNTYLEKIILFLNDPKKTTEYFVKKWPKNPTIIDYFYNNKLVASKGSKWSNVTGYFKTLSFWSESFTNFFKNNITFTEDAENVIKKNQNIFPLNVHYFK